MHNNLECFTFNPADDDSDDEETTETGTSNKKEESEEEEIEDLALLEFDKPKETIQKSKPKKAVNAEKSRKQQLIAAKEEKERLRKKRLEDAMKAAEAATGVKLTDKAKAKLIVEKSDNLLCDDLFDGCARVDPKEAVVYDGEDLMATASSESATTAALRKAEESIVRDPMETLERALEKLPLGKLADSVKASKLVADKLNASGNSTNAVQFVECLIKMVAPSLDSSQYQSLSKVCNVQYNVKKTQEKKLLGGKKSKKSKKKSVKTYKNDDFMADMGGDYAGGDNYW